MREAEERLEEFFINVKIKTMNHSIYDIIVNPLKTISSFQTQIQQVSPQILRKLQYH